MFNPERLLGQMVSGALGGALGGRMDKRRERHRSGGLSGGIGGGLGGLLSGNVGGKAQLGLGLLGVAMAAFEHYSQSGKQAQPAAAAPAGAPLMAPPAMTPPPPPPPMDMSASGATRAAPMLDLRRQEAMLLVRTMIAAAAADGSIDGNERAGILERARALGDDPESLRFLEGELSHPVSVAELVAQTPRSMADEIYAAAALSIDIDTEHERQWLDSLAHGLSLSPQTRQALHQQIGLA